MHFFHQMGRETNQGEVAFEFDDHFYRIRRLSIRLDEGAITKRIPTSDSTMNRVRTGDPTVRRLDPKAVAEALGGEPCADRIEGGSGPVTLYALRQKLIRRRQSSGGRPGIEGTSFRQGAGGRSGLASPRSRRRLSIGPRLHALGGASGDLLSIALRSVTIGLREEKGGQAVYMAESWKRKWPLV